MRTTAGPILIVDDDPDIRDFVEQVLVDQGYEVATASDGQVALESMECVHPRLILLDMRMPAMDGWAFAHAYRVQPGPHAPIVVMTAAQDAGERARQINAQGFLAKPFDLQDLLNIVHRLATQG